MAVPAAIMRIAAPMVKPLEYLNCIAQHQSSQDADDLHDRRYCSGSAGIADSFPVNIHGNVGVECCNKIPVIKHSAPVYHAPEMPDLAFSVFGSLLLFGTVSMTIRMIGMQIRIQLSRFHPAIAVNNPEPFAIRVPPCHEDRLEAHNP